MLIALSMGPSASDAAFCIASMDTPYVAGSQGTASAMESLASLIAEDVPAPVAFYTVGTKEDCETIKRIKSNASSTIIPQNVRLCVHVSMCPCDKHGASVAITCLLRASVSGAGSQTSTILYLSMLARHLDWNGAHTCWHL